MADEGAADRPKTLPRVGLGLASLLAHVAVVWFIPPAEPDTRGRDPNVELAPIELVEWQPPPEILEPTTRTREPELAPTEPPPDQPTRERPSPAPRGPSMSAGPDVPTPPVDPPAAPDPRDSGSDAVALPLSMRNANGRGPITSPRLSGQDTRDISGDHNGAAPPPASSDHNDATPQTLAEAGFLRNRKGDLVYDDPLGHFKATLLPDGRVRFRDFAVARGTIRSGGKVMGMSEIVRSAQGKDLWFLDKRKLLARTEKLRLAMAIKWAEVQVESRLRQLYRDLLEIWTDAERTVVQRRERLFQRWDECLEAMRVEIEGFGDAPKSTLDELRERAGGEARASIESFIRKHLPKDSADAYPPDELRELNRRRHSEERFDPYARGG